MEKMHRFPKRAPRGSGVFLLPWFPTNKTDFEQWENNFVRAVIRWEYSAISLTYPRRSCPPTFLGLILASPFSCCLVGSSHHWRVEMWFFQFFHHPLHICYKGFFHMNSDCFSNQQPIISVLVQQLKKRDAWDFSLAYLSFWVISWFLSHFWGAEWRF